VGGACGCWALRAGAIRNGGVIACDGAAGGAETRKLAGSRSSLGVWGWGLGIHLADGGGHCPGTGGWCAQRGGERGSPQQQPSIILRCSRA
jgi:hypothetical protein